MIMGERSHGAIVVFACLVYACHIFEVCVGAHVAVGLVCGLLSIPEEEHVESFGHLECGVSSSMVFSSS